MANSELDEVKKVMVLSKRTVNNANLGAHKGNFIFSDQS